MKLPAKYFFPMIASGIVGICVAVNFSDYTLWSVPEMSKSAGSSQSPIREDKVHVISTPKGIFRDITIGTSRG